MSEKISFENFRENHPIMKHYQEKVPRIFRFKLFENFFHIHQILALLYSLPKKFYLQDVIRALEVKRGFRLKIEGSNKIPVSGPLVVVANHPHIFVDQFSLGYMIETYRPESSIKIVTDNIPKGLENIYPYSEKVGKNDREKKVFREKIDKHLQNNGTLIILPGGKLNYRHWLSGMPVESKWRSGAIHFAQKNNASILPVYVSSKTTFVYNFLSNFLSRSWMQNFNFRQALKKEMYIGLSVGKPMLPSANISTEDLRKIVYRLGDDRYILKE